MEVWNGKWKKILVWNEILKKILVRNERFLVWNGNGNGRKLPVWNVEKSSSIPFHSMSCRRSLRVIPCFYSPFSN